MIKRLTFIFSLIIQQSLAQGILNYQSFVIDHKEVVWLQVFHEEHPVDQLRKELFDHLKQKSWIKDIVIASEEIVAEITDYRPDYKRYGGKFTNTSEIIRTGKWSGKMKISFKEGKYRVFLYGLNYQARQSTTGSGKATIEQHEVTGSLSEFVLNDTRTAFKKSKLRNLDILQFSFKDSFTIKADQLIDADW